MARSKAREHRLPKKLDDLVEFFETHDMGDYWDQMPEAQFEIDVKRKTTQVPIARSPVILFLGAGASAPLGKPVMEHFVKKLASDIKSDPEASLLAAFISERGNDLELIMGDIENLLSLSYVSTFVLDSGYEVNKNVAASLRSLIRHSIIREYRAIDIKCAIEVYQPLFDTIFSHIDPATFSRRTMTLRSRGFAANNTPNMNLLMGWTVPRWRERFSGLQVALSFSGSAIRSGTWHCSNFMDR